MFPNDVLKGLEQKGFFNELNEFNVVAVGIEQSNKDGVVIDLSSSGRGFGNWVVGKKDGRGERGKGRMKVGEEGRPERGQERVEIQNKNKNKYFIKK